MLAGVAFVISYSGAGAQAQGGAPSYVFDPSWPKPLPNKWKIGGVTGLAVDRNDDVWVLNRPNDLTRHRAPRRAHPADRRLLRPAAVDDPHQQDRRGHRLVRRAAGPRHGRGQQGVRLHRPGHRPEVRPKSGKVVGEIARVPETEGGGGAGGRGAGRSRAGPGGAGPVAGFITRPAAAGAGAESRGAGQAGRAARQAFRKKYPPDTPMIVGGLEEIRIDEGANEIYVADNYLGGRVLVFDLNTLAFKRGWGAYGKPLSQISTDDATRDYKPGGPMAKDFVGHLTLNFSNDGLVYAADRVGNRIHVTDKQGKFIKEFPLGRQHRRRRRPGRRRVLARQGAAVSVHLGSHEQPHLVPQSRRRQGGGPDGQHGRQRRPVLSAST